MSDLTAANCGCNDTCGCDRGSRGGCNSALWIFLIFILCGNNNGRGGCDCNSSMFSMGGNSSCSILIWILLINCVCGGNNSIFGC